MSGKPETTDFDKLLDAALSINDALRIHDDHVEFTGSMNQAEAFRELVNEVWHNRRFASPAEGWNEIG
jgi:hypothetical protein